MSRQESAYKRISALLEEEITSGKLKPGHRLPGEHELARRFGVSRTTIRQALADLARKQLITTRVGSGSYITFDNQPLEWSAGWSRALTSSGVAVESRIVHFGPVEDRQLGAKLGTGPHFIALDRLRIVSGGEPISLERSRVPLTDSTAALLDVDFRQESLMDVLTLRLGMIPTSSEEWIEVARLREDEAELLRRAVGEPFLLSRRALRDQHGSLMEYVASLLDPGHFRLHITFEREGWERRR